MQHAGEGMQNQMQTNMPAPPTQPRMARPSGASHGQSNSPIFSSLRPVTSGPQLDPSVMSAFSLPSQDFGSLQGSGSDGWYRPPGRPAAQAPQGSLPVAQPNYAPNIQPPVYSSGGPQSQYLTPYQPCPEALLSQHMWPGYPPAPRRPCRYNGYFYPQMQQERSGMSSGGVQGPGYNACPIHGYPAYGPLPQVETYFPSPGQQASGQGWSTPQSQPRHDTVQGLANQQTQSHQGTVQNLWRLQTHAQHGAAQGLANQQPQGQQTATQSLWGPQTHGQPETVQGHATQQVQTQQNATQNQWRPQTQAPQGLAEDLSVPQTYAQQNAIQGSTIDHTYAQKGVSESLSRPQTHVQEGMSEGLPGPQPYAQEAVMQGSTVQQGVSEGFSVPQAHVHQSTILDPTLQDPFVQQDVSVSPSIPPNHEHQGAPEGCSFEVQPTQPAGLGIILPYPPPNRTALASRPVNPAAPEFQPALARPVSTVEEEDAADMTDQKTPVDTTQPATQTETVEYIDWLDLEDNPLKEPWRNDAAYRYVTFELNFEKEYNGPPSDNQQQATDKINDEEEPDPEAQKFAPNSSAVESKSTRAQHPRRSDESLVPDRFPSLATSEAPNFAPTSGGGYHRDGAFTDWVRRQVASYLMNAVRESEQNSQQSPDVRELLRDPNGLLSDNFWEQANNPPLTLNAAYQSSGPELVRPVAPPPAVATPVITPLRSLRQLEELVWSQPISFVQPAEDVLGIAGSPAHARDMSVDNDTPFEIMNPSTVALLLPFDYTSLSRPAPVLTSLTQREAESTTQEAYLQRRLEEINEWYHSGLEETGLPGIGMRRSDTQQLENQQQIGNLFQLLYTRLTPYTDAYTNFQAPPVARAQQQSTLPRGRFPPFREPEPDFSTLQRRCRFLNSAPIVPYMGPSCTGLRPPPPQSRSSPRLARGNAVPRYAFEKPDGSPSPRERRRHLRL